VVVLWVLLVWFLGCCGLCVWGCGVVGLVWVVVVLGFCWCFGVWCVWFGVVVWLFVLVGLV
ncbi:hypothetical protein, partial [Pseudomonas syringae group genomosp. 7]|uniref:hypothetical protein n=1 Tax=Pseudomonas syringae group genomosp. 7 TaxID=251699 RepID=UPI0037700B28